MTEHQQEEFTIKHHDLACRIYNEFLSAKNDKDAERVKALKEMLTNRIAEIDRFFPTH